MKAIAVALLVGVVALCAGCAGAPKSLYYWGRYQENIYAVYNDPGKTPPETIISNLEEDYQKARSSANTITVAPGYHAYLGYLYFLTGKLDQAAQEFRTEKEIFPESATYMDWLLSAKGQTKKQ